MADTPRVPDHASAVELSRKFVDEVESAISRLAEGHAANELEVVVWESVGDLADLVAVGDAYIYELAVSRLVSEHPLLIDSAEAFLLIDHEAPPDIRLLAVAVVMIGHRRQRRFASGRRFAEAAFVDRQHQFGRLAGLDAHRHPMFVHLLALCFLDGDLENLKKGLALVREARSGFDRHAGVAHSFADFVTRIAAVDLDQAADMFDEAMAAVNEAIDLNPTGGVSTTRGPSSTGSAATTSQLVKTWASPSRRKTGAPSTTSRGSRTT